MGEATKPNELELPTSLMVRLLAREKVEESPPPDMRFDLDRIEEVRFEARDIIRCRYLPAWANAEGARGGPVPGPREED